MPREKPFRCKKCGELYVTARCPRCYPKKVKARGRWRSSGGGGRRRRRRVAVIVPVGAWDEDGEKEEVSGEVADVGAEAPAV